MNHPDRETAAEHTVEPEIERTAFDLGLSFLSRYPRKSARHLELTSPDEAAAILAKYDAEILIKIWRFFTPSAAPLIFMSLPDSYQLALLEKTDSHIAVALLARLSANEQESVMTRLAKQSARLANELTELLDYPENTAAKLMSANVQALYETKTAAEALTQLKQHSVLPQNTLYIINEAHTLVGEISLSELIAAEGDVILATLATPIKSILGALDTKQEVIDKFEGYRCDAMPVVDAHQQLIGTINFFDIYESTKIDLASDMQTMVGASKDEQALSSSWFAVKKRMPWLQINLLTAFAAAFVVGMFEGLIAQVTVLAILLPIAAGQSGNAGAQALAVTMRGLTLREITVRHWPKVLIKELMAGFLNGIAIAITCSLGVFIWSQSTGLAAVMAISMIASLVIASGAGAIVPIVLKKAGLDPAQSSSIVLTTVTDIAGFMAFLGTALMLADFLPKG